jgi:hypothetical protein
VSNANLAHTLFLEVPVALSVLPDLSRHQQGPRQAQCVLSVQLDPSLVLLARPHVQRVLSARIQILDHPSAHLALLEFQQLDLLQVVRLSLLVPSALLALQALLQIQALQVHLVAQGVLLVAMHLQVHHLVHYVLLVAFHLQLGRLLASHVLLVPIHLEDQTYVLRVLLASTQQVQPQVAHLSLLAEFALLAMQALL